MLKSLLMETRLASSLLFYDIFCQISSIKLRIIQQKLKTIFFYRPPKSRVLGINVGDIKARKWYLVVILLLYIGLITSFCLNISLLLRTYPKQNESSQTMTTLKSKGNFLFLLSIDSSFYGPEYFTFSLPSRVRNEKQFSAKSLDLNILLSLCHFF